MVFYIIFLVSIMGGVFAENCPNGGEIYARGISEEGKQEVVDAHNNYRLQIAQGNVPGQPKGINLKKMVYDDALGWAGKTVSDTCKAEHNIANDDRWGWVGQNIYMQMSTEKSTDQDWNGAVESWFNEHDNFIYPNSPTEPGKVTGHYTQLIWANSDHVGCDFISFYSPNEDFPYRNLYTCNYGPGGNYDGEAPYETGDSGCENLC